jgi:hypothetical protein
MWRQFSGGNSVEAIQGAALVADKLKTKNKLRIRQYY